MQWGAGQITPDDDTKVGLTNVPGLANSFNAFDEMKSKHTSFHEYNVIPSQRTLPEALHYVFVEQM